MKPTLKIVVHPSGGKGRPLTVDDAMSQILDVMALIEARGDSRLKGEKFKWVLVGASTNSPLTVDISVEGDPSQSHIWAAHAADDIEDVTRTLHMMAEEKTVPSWLPGKSIKTAKRLLKRNLNGISVTEIRADTGSNFFLDPAKSEIALGAIEHFSSPAINIGKHRAKSDVTGYLVKAGEFHGKSAFWLRDKRGNEVACVMGGKLEGVIGDATKLIDVWKNRRINVSGIKHLDSTGKILRLEVTSPPVAAPKAEKRVNLDRILDDDFTGGKDPETYLGNLRGDHG